MVEYLSAYCDKDHCEYCHSLSCGCSCHEECDICGEPLSIGNHEHLDGLWG